MRGLWLGAAVLLSIWLLAVQRRAPTLDLRAAYTLVPRGGERAVDVVLDVVGLGRGERTFGMLVDDALVRVTGFCVEQPPGASVRVAAPAPAAAATRYVVEAPGPDRHLRIRYTVAPERFVPAGGDRDVRRFGHAGPSGIFMALPALLMLPAERPDAIELEARLPAGWTVLQPLPRRLECRSYAEVWGHALIAGPSDRPEPIPGGGVRVSALNAGAGVLGAVDDIIAQLEGALGPPRRALHLVVFDAEDSAEVVELPSGLPCVPIDLPAADVGSLRRLVRALVPRWFGRTLAEVETDAAGESWFPFGLTEYLAAVLPARAGASPRDGAAGLERAWVLSRDLAHVDVQRPASDPEGGAMRRAAAAALFHELLRRLGASADPSAVLHGYDGNGHPRLTGRGRRRAFEAFVREHVDGREPLSFEEGWSVRLAETSPRASLPIESALTLVFTANTEGVLEHCGCTLGQEGGVAQRAAAVRRVRSEDPDLLLLDLGHFTPIEPTRARLAPSVREELRANLAALDLMGYDALTVGPDDLYSGATLLGPGAPPLRATATGAGLRIGQLWPLAPRVIVERHGIRIGYVGYSELVELGFARDPHEVNLVGVEFPRGAGPLVEAARGLRAEVDLLVIGGRVRPSTLREICLSDVQVDLVLLAGYRSDERRSGADPRDAGFLGTTAVAYDTVGSSGINQLTVFLSADRRIVDVHARRTRLPADGPRDAEVVGLLHELYADLAREEQAPAPLFERDPWQRGEYAGAQACRACHVAEFEQWNATRHAQALDTLAAARRLNVPKCVRCHVVGLGTASGYSIEKPDPRLAGVQCETCHGSGAEHASDPLGAPLRRDPGAQVCLECHDEEHSRGFVYERALEHVRHGGRFGPVLARGR